MCSRALCQCKRFIGNIRPGAQILSSGSMQKNDSALNVLPAVQAVLSIVSSLTRKRGARSLGENECVGSCRVTPSLPNTSSRLSSFASFFLKAAVARRSARSATIWRQRLKKGPCRLAAQQPSRCQRTWTRQHRKLELCSENQASPRFHDAFWARR